MKNWLCLIVLAALVMVMLTPAPVGAEDEYPALHATTPAGALFAKFFVLTDRIMGQFINTSYDADKGVYTIGEPTELGNAFVGDLTVALANFTKILADILRMLAGAPVESPLEGGGK